MTMTMSRVIRPIANVVWPIVNVFKRHNLSRKPVTKKVRKKSVIGDFLPNIVVKFYDNISFPYNEDANVQEYFSTNKLFPWQELQEKFPGIRIGKLFNSLKPEQIKQMVDKIKKSNPGYNPPDFLACAFIDYTESEYGQELLSIIIKSEIVEYAYIESDA